MASTCKYFDEDAVYRTNKKGLVDFGLVIENSEFISSDEEDIDDVELPEWEKMKRGHVRIAWHPKGQEEVLPEKKVILFDRSLMPGDVVRRVIKGKDTQLGYCRNTNVLAAVQLVGTKQVIPDVNSKDLIPLEEFSADIAVFLDSWVGMVKIVKSEITVRCSDGSRAILTDDDAFDLDDILDKRDKASEFKKYSFYPGQQLWGPVHCFDKCKWLTLNKEMNSLLPKPTRTVRVTVEDVKVVSMGVQWLCRAYCNTISTEIEQPKFLVQGEDLKRVKMMHIFEPCALQIGDRNFYVIKENDKIMSLNEWKHSLTGKLCPEKVLISSSSKGCQTTGNGDETTTEVLTTDDQNAINQNDSDFESVDEDEEGTSDTASQSSYSTSSSVGANKKGNKKKPKKGPSLATKMLKKKKLKRARQKLLQEILPLKPDDRVVTETLVTATKADVVWQDGSVEEDIPSASLYPVHHLDGHEFFPGDFVIENKDNPRPHEYGVVKKVDHTGRTAFVTWMKTYVAGRNPQPEILSNQEISVYDIKDHPDFRYRPGSCVIRVANIQDTDPSCTAGQVIDVHSSGQVQVSWVSGKTCLCYPQELYRVGEYDSDDLWGDDESFGDDDNDSWETESEGSAVGVEESNEKDSVEEKKTEKQNKTQEKAQVTEDTKTLREKLLANIEKLRAGMARLEEVFTQNPTLQTTTVMRKLLELYKHCRLLDLLLGTSYFHERHLQYLVDRLRQRGRINSAQHMADQISRLFSVIDNELIEESEREGRLVNSSSLEVNDSIADIQTELENKIRIEKEDSQLENGTEGKEKCSSEVTSPTSLAISEPRNVCRQLCSILKSRLLKAHEDVEHRFGMSANSASDALQAANDAVTTSEQQNFGEESKENHPISAQPEKEESKSFTKEESKEDKLGVTDTAGQGEFSMLEAVPDSHKYKLSILQPNDPHAFFRTVKKEMQLLRTSLPEGIIVKSFDDRMDLYSVLIRGPVRTPYEDGLFLFDFQLPADYPKVPPLCHYISYCSDRLNPNLYEGGKVCVSLLGTWGGKGTEVWCSSTSSLLQVIVSIQGLILVCEPYFNEAGYERQRGTQLGRENSRMYNEMVVLKLIQSMGKLIQNPPETFKEEIFEHFNQHAARLVSRLESWLKISEEWNIDHPTSPTSPTAFKEIHNQTRSVQGAQVSLPEYPLIPASKGFCLTLKKSLVTFKEILVAAGIQIS